MCGVCVWGTRGHSQRGIHSGQMQPLGSPCPSLSPPHPCTQRCHGLQEAQGSSHAHFTGEETEALCFQALASLAELFPFMHGHQGQELALVLQFVSSPPRAGKFFFMSSLDLVAAPFFLSGQTMAPCCSLSPSLQPEAWGTGEKLG